MKALIIIGFFLLVFFGTFFILSLAGLLWVDTYSEIIRDRTWFMIYTLFIGTWVGLVSTHEVYEDMFDHI